MLLRERAIQVAIGYSNPQRTLRIFRESIHLRVSPSDARQPNRRLGKIWTRTCGVFYCEEAGSRSAPERAAATLQERQDVSGFRLAIRPEDDHPDAARLRKLRPETHQASRRSKPEIVVAVDMNLFDYVERRS